MKLPPALVKGTLVAALGGAVVLASTAPALAAPAEAAESAAYIADGAVLGQSVVRLWETNADATTPSDADGGSLTLGPLTFNAVTSESSVDLTTGAVSARSSVAAAQFALGNYLGTVLSLNINTIGASCAINEDGSVSANSSTPLVTLIADPPLLPPQSITVPFVNGVATIGFQGLNLGTIALGETDTDISDGVVGAEGVRLTFLNAGPVQAGSLTIGSASCGPVVPLAEVDAIHPAAMASLGGVGLLGLGAQRLIIKRRDAIATE